MQEISPNVSDRLGKQIKTAKNGKKIINISEIRLCAYLDADTLIEKMTFEAKRATVKKGKVVFGLGEKRMNAGEV